jgi:hypothetical protein
MPDRASTEKVPVPAGYHQAVTTAMTVFLGFSITFLRIVWEAVQKKGWTLAEMFSESVVFAGIILQVTALFRALDVSDDDVVHYRPTIVLFKSGVVVVIVGVVLALVERR